MTTGSIQAKSALNVSLTRFKAIPLDDAVRLEKVTETDLGTTTIFPSPTPPTDNSLDPLATSFYIRAPSTVASTVVYANGLAGKIYLWVAFAAALIIFTAAVLGAILLYTRQRYKE